MREREAQRRLGWEPVVPLPAKNFEELTRDFAKTLVGCMQHRKEGGLIDAHFAEGEGL